MRKTLTLTLCSFILLSCATAQTASKKKTKNNTAQVKTQPSKKSNEKIKDYDKVITKEAISDEGLFDVHLVGEKYYFEIPMAYLNTDMLLVSRFLN